MKQRTVLIEIELFTSAKLKDLKERAKEFGKDDEKVDQVQINVIQKTK